MDVAICPWSRKVEKKAGPLEDRVSGYRAADWEIYGQDLPTLPVGFSHSEAIAPCRLDGPAGWMCVEQARNRPSKNGRVWKLPNSNPLEQAAWERWIH